MDDSQSVPGSSIAPKFESFAIKDVPYKHVNSTPLLASIMVPNDAKPGKHPVMVHWHGGGFVTGTRLFPDWFGDWLLALATKHSAIIVTPDYRLLPEARGADILADTADFLRWLGAAPDGSGSGLAAVQLPRGVEADVGAGVLVTGESAGGWLALQSGLVAAAADVGVAVRAVIVQYPVIDLAAPHFTQAHATPLFDARAPQMALEAVRAHVHALAGGEVVAGRWPPDGMALTLAMIQHGLYAEFFGLEPELLLLDALDRVQTFPPLWIVHGTADILVPVEGTEKFAAKFRQRLPGVDFHVTLVDGEDHGFDNHDKESGAPATLDTAWVKPGVEMVEKYWPSSG